MKAVPATGARTQGAPQAIRWLAIGVPALILLAMVSLVVTSARGGATTAEAASHDPHGAQPLATQNVAAALPAAAPRAAGAVPSVSAMDRDLLIRVRLAGLWEVPAGQMAAAKGQSQRVRDIGEKIGGQHVRLDELTIAASNQLGVELPTEPTHNQKRWLAEMENAQGAAFDQIFVDRLRSAHGSIFPAIAQVRSTTSNDVVRDVASAGNGYVLTHISLLESTGMVQYDALKSPKAAAGPLASVAAKSQIGGVSLSVIWIILAVALIAGGIGSTRLLRPRWIGGGIGRRNSKPARSYAPRTVPAGGPRTPAAGYPRPGTTSQRTAPAPSEYGYPNPRRQSSSRRLVP